MAVQAGTLADALRDRYELQRELGRGGMATVYLARDLKHDRLVALKLLHPELAATLGPERFLREIRLTAGLEHPRILPVFDSGEAHGILWYTMPYVEGESLRDRLRREGQLPVEDGVRIAREVADALDYAHRHGVVHRDIKPENIMLGEGHTRLADFGVARAVESAGSGPLTETGLSVGTPAYMSPEQASGGRVDGRSDTYALGCVLYEMLAGEPPFTGPTAQAVIAKRFAEPVPHLGTLRTVPARIEAAVTKALARAPADRFRTPMEFAAALADGAVISGSRRGRRSLAAMAGLVAVGCVVAVVVALARRGSGATSLTSPPGFSATSGSPSEPTRSIAVLPFVNLTASPDDEYFSDGMTEELIDALANLPELQVAARTSSFAFKGKSADVREIGRRLGVATVLEGSVRRSGRRVRVTAQLIKSTDGYHLWSKTYDSDLEDVFALQDEVAKAIVGALQVRLMGGDSLIVRPATSSAEAHDLYLKGRFFLVRGNHQALRSAIGFLEQSVAKDSSYALAYSGLADAYFMLGSHGYMPPKETLPRAKAAALKALALDSSLAEAHVSAAWIARWWDWDRPWAEREFRKAVALNPRYSEAYRFHAWFLVDQVDTAGAIREMRRAVELDPLSVIASGQLGAMYALAGNNDSAIAQQNRTLELDPTNVGQRLALSGAYVRRGKFDQALAQLRAAGPSTDPATDFNLKNQYLYLYVHTGRAEDARRMLEEMQRIGAHNYIRPDWVAAPYAILGNKEKAFAWLERAVKERAVGPELNARQVFASLHSDPRWARILETMHLDTAR